MKKLVGTAMLVGVLCAFLAAWPSHDVGAACCYFAAQDKDINQPGQKAFIQWVPAEKLEAFTVQPKFEGNAVDFGMVIPTPAQPKLDEMPRDFFKDLAIYTILLPLPESISVEPMANLRGLTLGGAPGKGGGPPAANAAGKDDLGVNVLEAGVVGSLDYKVISAEKADGLFQWLKENGYVYSGDEKTLGFYVDKQWFFTVMKIDPKQMKRNDDGSYAGEVTPTKFTFTSDACIYPLRITAISVKDKTDALFYVQAPSQMDLQGDLSWKHSYRVMWLTYMLGCCASPEQQRELTERTQWVQNKMAKDAGFETTKLEWARRLGDADMAVLEDPLAHYAQMGGGDLPAGAKMMSREEFRKAAADVLKKAGNDEKSAADRLKELETDYPEAKGQIALLGDTTNNSFYWTPYLWMPNREAPEAEVKGLSRLKGHLASGQWITKFRKVLRKAEMTDDLVLSPVEAGTEQEYIRIMPTSPP